jgi:DNA-binding response OmpR family regulator
MGADPSDVHDRRHDGAGHGRPGAPGDGCRVLVVEDERTIAANLHEYLSARGFEVDLAHDGAAAIARLGAETFDVVVLDLGLPRVAGGEVLERLRRTLRVATPVLVLTARDALGDKLDAFGLGADDYLVKPFAMAEVAVRIAALHRRARGATVEDVLATGALRLDRRTHEASFDGTALRLGPMSMRLLERLLRDPGRVVPRSELEAALWPDDPPGGDVLRGQVHLLRRALAAAGFTGLETVHGVGWRIAAPASDPPR